MSHPDRPTPAGPTETTLRLPPLHAADTTVLHRVPDPWPATDPDTERARARQALRRTEAPGMDVLRRVLTGLRALPPRPCALCAAEPVARPDQPYDTVDGRFCGGCIQRCLDDSNRAHWCAIDTLGSAEH